MAIYIASCHIQEVGGGVQAPILPAGQRVSCLGAIWVARLPGRQIFRQLRQLVASAVHQPQFGQQMRKLASCRRQFGEPLGQANVVS